MFRFCAVLITQSVSGFYKAFGQSFIADDHFLSFVGAVSSVFNCTGRLFYGILMDRFLSWNVVILNMPQFYIEHFQPAEPATEQQWVWRWFSWPSLSPLFRPLPSLARWTTKHVCTLCVAEIFKWYWIHVKWYWRWFSWLYPCYHNTSILLDSNVTSDTCLKSVSQVGFTIWIWTIYA